MKDVKKETAKLLLESSRNLAQLVASSSFEFWERKDFRLYTEFVKLPQSEQDRLFNELEVSVLGLFTLHFEYAQTIAAKKEKKDIMRIMQQELKKSFLMLFSDLGVEEKFVNQWDELIEMRLKEYRRDLKTALSETRGMGEFQGDDHMWNTWARIETITIDCLSHIRKGNVEENDPLWKLLRKWFIAMDASLNPIVKLSQEK